MILLTYDLATGTIRVTQNVPLKVGADVPVRLTFSAAPGVVSSLQLALGSNSDAPEVLAYTEDFDQENPNTWTAVLDANDTRLLAFMAGKGPTQVNAELVAVIDGVRQVSPNAAVTVQPAIISGPGSSEGGPTYYTQAQVDAAIAAATPRFFTNPITNGASTVAVTFVPAFASVPAISGLVVLKAASGDGDLSVVSIYGLTVNGFTAVLSAAAPIGTYSLHGSAKIP